MSNPQLPNGYSFYVTDGDVLPQTTLTGKPQPMVSRYSGLYGAGWAFLHVLAPSPNRLRRLFGAAVVTKSEYVYDSTGHKVRTHQLTDEILRENMKDVATSILERIEREDRKSRYIGAYPPKDVDNLG